jgi:hypothetical protein
MLEEFLKSGYGRIFMEQQLPGIINGMTTLATEMKRANDLKEQELKTSQPYQNKTVGVAGVGIPPSTGSSVQHPHFTRKGSQSRSKADGTTYMVEVIEDHLGQEYTRFVNVPAARPQRRP